jgi:hypothetical protein
MHLSHAGTAAAEPEWTPFAGAASASAAALAAPPAAPTRRAGLPFTAPLSPAPASGGHRPFEAQASLQRAGVSASALAEAALER